MYPVTSTALVLQLSDILSYKIFIHSNFSYLPTFSFGGWKQAKSGFWRKHSYMATNFRWKVKVVKSNPNCIRNGYKPKTSKMKLSINNTEEPFEKWHWSHRNYAYYLSH